MTYYLLTVNASDSGSSVWNLNPSFLSLTTASSGPYEPVANYSVVALMGNTTVSPGEHTMGRVAFELPAGQTPSTLTYSDSKGGVSIEAQGMPGISGVASRFDPSVHFTLNGTSWANTITTWAAITNQTNALAFFGGEANYKNSSFIFFTGQRISVTFAFYYYRLPSYPETIAVRAITSSDGYQVSDVLAWQETFGFSGYNTPSPLPETMTGYGSNLEVTLLATVPPGPQPGVLHFTVQFGA
jgi:hypothetical protein